ncbi:MAG: hypothetical protein EZS28_046571, partial [Streblomastix strix]
MKRQAPDIGPAPRPQLNQHQIIADTSYNSKSNPQFTGKQKQEHRSRMNEDLLIQNLFRIFDADSPCLSTESLNKQLDQPDQFLKEVLNKIALQEYQKQVGIVYFLRPEYRSKVYNDRLELDKKRREELELKEQMKKNPNANPDKPKSKAKIQA